MRQPAYDLNPEIILRCLHKLSRQNYFSQAVAAGGLYAGKVSKTNAAERSQGVIT
jgi:hypothetical protein